ncbi:MAG TPA: hypothetical protein VFM94_06270 [Solirubrobacterales bacterium]|nr:hypothetical protein [Solirubrobacterales bacterium]
MVSLDEAAARAAANADPTRFIEERDLPLLISHSGLACQLAGYEEDRFVADETGMAGLLFENFVASVSRPVWF